MPYDPKLDEKLFSESFETATDRLTVSIYSYNKGQQKLQISREAKTGEEGEMKFSKLGRLTKEETQGVLPLIQEALKKMA